MFSARDLRAGYGRAQVIHGIDLDVPDGALVLVLGANGAGKTTLLRALSGMIKARGIVTLAERRLTGLHAEQLARLGVTHVPQGRGTFAELTVEENLRIGAIRLGRTTQRSEIDRWLGIFPHLAERRASQAGHLSGGEQQMLAIARACISRPRLLMCDEPSLGLAPNVARIVFESLLEIRSQSGLSLLVVEQAAGLLVDKADTVYVLESGEIVRAGAPSDVLADDTLRRAYLGLAAAR